MNLAPKKPAQKPKNNGEKKTDIHIGRKLQLRRNILGISQEKLGDAINVSFQQIQKYEKGKNRISASKLHEMSQVLSVPVYYFFEDLIPSNALEAHEAGSSFESETLNQKETHELLRNYYRISNPDLRKKVLDIVKTIGLSEKESKA